MCWRDKGPRNFIYHRRQPDGIPTDFPNPHKVFVLEDNFYCRGGPFQRLLDCGGMRYVLLLELNEDLSDRYRSLKVSPCWMACTCGCELNTSDTSSWFSADGMFFPSHSSICFSGRTLEGDQENKVQTGDSEGMPSVCVCVVREVYSVRGDLPLAGS